MDRLREHADRQHYPSEIRDTIASTIASLVQLARVLDAIHRPYSTHKDDPDNQVTDDEWTEIESQATNAENELASTASSAAAKAAELDAAFNAERRMLLDKIRVAEEVLLYDKR